MKVLLSPIPFKGVTEMLDQFISMQPVPSEIPLLRMVHREPGGNEMREEASGALLALYKGQTQHVLESL